MINHKRDGKITFVELLLIVVILAFGYWVMFSPITKTEDMVKEEWILRNLMTINDAVGLMEKDIEFSLEEMSLNDVDILRSRLKKPPLEWPDGVDIDSFMASSNGVSIAAEFSTGIRKVTYVSEEIQE